MQLLWPIFIFAVLPRWPPLTANNFLGKYIWQKRYSNSDSPNDPLFNKIKFVLDKLTELEKITIKKWKNLTFFFYSSCEFDYTSVVVMNN